MLDWQAVTPDPGESIAPGRTRLAQRAERFGLSLLMVFGSRAGDVLSWLADPSQPLPPTASDVDIGVLADRPLSLDEKVDIALALERLLGVARVDVVDLATADPFLAANIIRGERLYARDEHEANEFELFVLRRAGDLAPLERERLALILGEAQ